ncbi:MAG: ABC transporter substrate-binding protein [Prevotella sp.]|nr:ABC transporter substrate-binding protein [Prevotella sp.]
MIKRLCCFIGVILLTLVVVSACSSKTGNDVDKDRNRVENDSTTLKVGVTPTLDCLPVFLADELGIFDRLQADVRLVRFNAHMDGDERLLNKSIDGTISDLIRAERLKAKGLALEYSIATNTYWQLITNRLARITQLNQLGDKMLAITRYSATDYLGNLAVDSAKPKNNVYRIQVNDVMIRLKMLETNSMDALLLTEPQATQARNAKHPVLMDSRDKDLHLGVFAFRTGALRDNTKRQTLDKFITAYNQACDSLNINGFKHYSDIVMRNCLIDKKILKALPKMKYEHAAPPREKDIQTAKNVKWKD